MKGVAAFKIMHTTDTFVLIADMDSDGFPSITNSAHGVIELLSVQMNLTNRAVIYRDTMGRFDELRHDGHKFTGFSPCTSTQQVFFRRVFNKACFESRQWPCP